MDDRDTRLAAAFIDLSAALVGDYDTIEILSGLVHQVAQYLGAAEVGIMLADSDDQLRRVASSTERMRVLELFELQSAEGPCVDCYRSGQAVLGEDLSPAHELWATFAPMARSVGFTVVYALPLHLRGEAIGAMNVFLDEKRSLSTEEVAVVQAFADLATVAITQQRSLETAGQLQAALDSRVVIEQAKGMLAQQLGIDVAEAFDMLRSYSRHTNRRLGEVAGEFVAGTVPVELATATPSTRQGQRSSHFTDTTQST